MIQCYLVGVVQPLSIDKELEFVPPCRKVHYGCKVTMATVDEESTHITPLHTLIIPTLPLTPLLPSHPPYPYRYPHLTPPLPHTSTPPHLHTHTSPSTHTPICHGYLRLPVVETPTNVHLIPTTVPSEHDWYLTLSCVCEDVCVCVCVCEGGEVRR